MLKSFDKYILKEIISPFGLGFLVYTFTLVLNHIPRLSDAYISRGASGFTILKIIIFMLPNLLSFTIPMATLMGVLAGLSRMSTDSEIIAFKTVGIKNSRILKPVMIFSVSAWLVSSLFTMYIEPEANFRLNRLLTKVFLSRTVTNIKPKTFYREFPYYILYVNHIDNKTNEWEDVFLYSQRDGLTDTIILAESGNFFQKESGAKSAMVLRNPNVHSYKKKDPGKEYHLQKYTSLIETIPDLVKIKQTRSSTQLIFPDLIKKMKEKPENLMLAIEFHQKLSLPFACLILGFLALSLGISTKKGGKISGFIISLGIIFLYYTTMTVSRNIVLKKMVSPFLGIWAANFFLIVVALILYYYSSKEKNLNWENLFSLFNKFRLKKVKGGKVLFILKIKRIKVKFFRILDIYVIKRLMLTFLLIFTSLILIFYIINIIELIDDVIENKSSFYLILKYIYYNTPELINFVLPISILTSVLLAFSVMSKNNEITAVQVSGISLYRLALPAILTGLLFSLFYFYIQEYVTPDANKRANEILNQIHNRDINNINPEFQKNWVLGKDGKFYFYRYFNKRNNRFESFNILSLTKTFSMRKRISAKHAYWISNTELQLVDGFERKFVNNFPRGIFNKFETKTVFVKGGKKSFTRKIAYSRYMNIKDLKNYMAYLEDSNTDTRKYEAKLYHKYAFPFSNLIMVLIAIPFSFIMGKKGTLYGIGIAVAISMIFWGVSAVFNSLGTSTLLTPFISAFAPIFLFGAASIYLFLNIKT